MSSVDGNAGGRKAGIPESVFILLKAWICFLVIGAPALPVGASAASSSFLPAMVEEDGNRDGRIDRRAWFDGKNRPARIEADTDGDGRFDLTRVYSGGTLQRSEWDSDHDGVKDRREWYVKGVRVKQQEIDRDTGRVVRETLFDSHDLPAEMKIFNPATGAASEVRHYRDGLLHSTALDGTGDRFLEQTTRYRDGRPQVTEWDEDKDGKPDRILRYGADGRPEKEERGRLASGGYRKTSLYTDGKLHRSLIDTDGDGVPEETGIYVDGRLTLRELDSVDDGTPDLWIEYDNGKAVVVREDTDGNGRPDVIERYTDSGVLSRRSRDLDEDGEADIDTSVMSAGAGKP